MERVILNWGAFQLFDLLTHFLTHSVISSSIRSLGSYTWLFACSLYPDNQLLTHPSDNQLKYQFTIHSLTFLLI